jgi:hypothetical protein
MASTISAGTTSGTALNLTGDTTGNLAFTTQAGANTISVPNTTGTLALTSQLPVAGPAFSAYGTALQSASNATFTKIAYNTEEFDTASYYDSTTNYRFTPLIAGYYQFNATIGSSNAVTGFVGLSFYKNGSRFKDGTFGTNGNNGPICSGSALIYLNGSTDYVEVFGYQNSGTSLNIGSAGVNFAFSGALERTA